MSRAIFNIIATTIGFAFVFLLLGKGSTRHKTQLVTLVFAAAIFGISVAEAPTLLLGLDYQRVFRTNGGRTTLHLLDGVNKPDSTLIQIHWPNTSFRGSVEGNLVAMGIPTRERYEANVQYDSNGFRNPTTPTAADIAVIGDSFVEGAIIPREKSLVSRIEALTNARTANLGQIDYGLRQELEVLRRFALPLKPKLVIWVMFGGNDLRDVEYYERNLKRISNATKNDNIVITNEASLIDPFFNRSLVRNSLVFFGGYAEDVIRTTMQWPRSKALNRSGLFNRADGSIERVYFGQTADPWNPHQWNVATSTLTEASRLSKASGAEFLIAYIPRKYRIYRDHITISSNHVIAGWSLNNLPVVLREWCAQANIKFVDLSPHLESEVRNGRHTYFVDDVHWNSNGHDVAARAIVRFLEDSKMFPYQHQ